MIKVNKTQIKTNNRGITLIALIITVIVLLILAGVTINLTVGENGIFAIAKQAVIENKKAAYFEKINLAIMEEQTERAIQEKEEAFIMSLKEKIGQEEWTEPNKVLIAKEKDGGYERVEEGEEKGANILIVETKDGYEIIIDVNSVEKTAVIRDTFNKVGKTYKIKYNGNGGTGDSPEEQEIRSGFAVKLLSNTYSKTGYNFAGWSENKEGTEQVYQPNTIYTPQKDTTLYAIWSKNTVTITFNKNAEDATESMDAITVVQGTETALPSNNFKRTGYSFVKWNTQVDGKGTDYASGAKIQSQTDITLYAIWEKNVVATLNINNNKKLTEGTTFTITGTAYSSTIKTVEVTVGTVKVYTEEVVNGGTTYNKTIPIDNLSNIANLTFNDIYEAKVKITSTSGISKEEKVQEVKNYTIGNATNLEKLATLVNRGTTFNGETIYQVADIDLNGSSSNQFEGIGYYGTKNGVSQIVSLPFEGRYNGNNKKIQNIYINNTTKDTTVGLFNYCSGIIENVTLSGSVTQNGSRAMGGICGRLATEGIIKNCINNSNVTASNRSMIAGICGNMYDSQILDCTNNGIISGVSYIGGICGTISAENAVIENCKNSGKVSGTYEIGGIVGSVGSQSTANVRNYQIKNCGNTEEVIAEYKVGGIIGTNYGTVEQCYNEGKINATGYDPGEDLGSSIGGISGVNENTITKCMNKGEITAASNWAGGIAGRNINILSYCCNLGNIKGSETIGGIVGNNRGYVTYVYNAAKEITVDGIRATGIAGNQNTNENAYIKYAYNKSKVNGTQIVAGIVGVLATGTVSNTYNMGTISATNLTNSGQIYGKQNDGTTVNSSTSVEETVMKGWSQATITTNLGSFVKKTNSLPILNITIPIYKNYIF